MHYTILILYFCYISANAVTNDESMRFQWRRQYKRQTSKGEAKRNHRGFCGDLSDQFDLLFLPLQSSSTSTWSTLIKVPLVLLHIYLVHFDHSPPGPATHLLGLLFPYSFTRSYQTRSTLISIEFCCPFAKSVYSFVV